MNNFFRSRFFVVLIIITCFLAGFMLNVAVDGGVMPHRTIVGIITTPFTTLGTNIKTGVSNFFAAYTKYEKLLTENEALKKENSDLLKRLEDSYTLEVEIKRLEQLANILETTDTLELIDAQVVSVSTDGWNSVFSINKGSMSGIKAKDVVIASSGLVGKVREVGPNWATVVAFTDPQIAVGAMITRTEDTAMTEGTVELKAKGLCKLSYLSKNSSAIRGDIVETSGLGGLYPAGIVIGTIKDISIDDNGLTKYAVIQPAVDFSELKHVYVSINYASEESE